MTYAVHYVMGYLLHLASKARFGLQVQQVAIGMVDIRNRLLANPAAGLRMPVKADGRNSPRGT